MKLRWMYWRLSIFKEFKTLHYFILSICLIENEISSEKCLYLGKVDSVLVGLEQSAQFAKRPASSGFHCPRNSRFGWLADSLGFLVHDAESLFVGGVNHSYAFFVNNSRVSVAAQVGQVVWFLKINNQHYYSFFKIFCFVFELCTFINL